MYPVFLKLVCHIEQRAGRQNKRLLNGFIRFGAVSNLAWIAQRDNGYARAWLKITRIVCVEPHFATACFIEVEQAVVKANIKGVVELLDNGNQRRMHRHRWIGHLSVVVGNAKRGCAACGHAAFPGNRAAQGLEQRHLIAEEAVVNEKVERRSR